MYIFLPARCRRRPATRRRVASSSSKISLPRSLSIIHSYMYIHVYIPTSAFPPPPRDQASSSVVFFQSCSGVMYSKPKSGCASSSRSSERMVSRKSCEQEKEHSYKSAYVSHRAACICEDTEETIVRQVARRLSVVRADGQPKELERSEHGGSC